MRVVTRLNEEQCNRIKSTYVVVDCLLTKEDIDSVLSGEGLLICTRGDILIRMEEWDSIKAAS